MYMSHARFKCTNEALNILYMFSFFNEIKLYLLPALTENFQKKNVSNAIKLLEKMELLTTTESRYLIENSNLIQMYARTHKLFHLILVQMVSSLTYNGYDFDLDTHTYLNKIVFNTIWLILSDHTPLIQQFGGTKDVLGKTCLHYFARYSNKKDIMEFALKNCPDLDIDCMAITEIVPKTFKNFIKVPDDNCNKSQNNDTCYDQLLGCTALHEASYFYNKPAIDLLLKFKADTTKLDKYGNTADFWIEVFWEDDLPCFMNKMILPPSSPPPTANNTNPIVIDDNTHVDDHIACSTESTTNNNDTDLRQKMLISP